MTEATPAAATPATTAVDATSTPPAVTATPDVAAQGTPSADWTSGLDDAGKQLLSVKGWKTPADAIKSYSNLEKALGSDKLPLPPAGKDGARDFKTWDGWAKLGVPETPDAYTFTPPEGRPFTPADEAFQASMRPALHAAKLAPWQAEILAGAMNQQTAGLEAAAAALKEQGTAALRKEWGGAFDAKLDLANRAARQMFGGDLPDATQVRLADGTYLLDNPSLAKAFAALGEQLAEDTTSPGAGPASGGMPTTPDAARAEIQRIRGESHNNPKHPYWDVQHPEHKALHVRMSNLYAFADPARA